MGLYVKKCPKCHGAGRTPKLVFPGTRECKRCGGEGMTFTLWYRLLGPLLPRRDGSA